MEKKFVRLILFEGDHEVLVPDDLILPYENLVKTAYRIFEQDPDRVKFSLYYENSETSVEDRREWLIGQSLWNSGVLFSPSRPFRRLQCVFTPIERGNAYVPELGTFGGRRDSFRQASSDVQPSSRSSVRPASNGSTSPLHDNAATFASDDATQELSPEQQPKRKASPGAQQEQAPPTHKRIRPFSPRQYYPKEQQVAKVGAPGTRRRSYHRRSALPQSPSSSTRRRDAQQKPEDDQNSEDGQKLGTDATSGSPQPDPGLVLSPRPRSSSSSSSSLSPVPESVSESVPDSLFLTPPPRRASADEALLRMRAQTFQNVLDGPRRVSFDTRILGQGAKVARNAGGLYLDSIKESADNKLSRHGAIGRKNGPVDLTFFFKSEIHGHTDLKIPSWTVTYRGNETLKKREKEIRQHIGSELYNNNPNTTERQRQGIVSQLAIFIYVYYRNTTDRQDMLDRKYADHEHELWEFLRADMDDSEPAKLDASITLHRKSDVDMKLFDRLSPTKSSRVADDDGGDSDDEDFVVADPIDDDARIGEDQDGDYEDDGDGDQVQTSPVRDEET